MRRLVPLGVHDAIHRIEHAERCAVLAPLDIAVCRHALREGGHLHRAMISLNLRLLLLRKHQTRVDENARTIGRLETSEHGKGRGEGGGGEDEEGGRRRWHAMHLVWDVQLVLWVMLFVTQHAQHRLIDLNELTLSTCFRRRHLQ